MTITLLRISKFFLYAAVFSVLIVLTGTFFPFIGGKYYFFRFCVEMALMFLLLWWAFEANSGELEERVGRVLRQPLFRAVAAFALAFVLAAIIAHNPYGAFWSNYERGEGGFQMLHYLVFFAMLALLLDKERDWRFLFKCSLVAATGLIAYGLLAADLVPGFIGQYTNPDGTPVGETFLARLFAPNVRFQGSLGNPAYVAPYLMFSMFYILYLWFADGRLDRRHWQRQAAFGAFLALVFLIFILSQTRGAFLGLGAGGLAFFAYLIFSQPRLRKPAAITLAGLVILLAILVANRESPLLKSLPGNRLLYTSPFEATAQTRFWTWGTAWRGFLERPVFGWGPENFSTVFDKYFDPRHFVPGQSTETWFDRAHSVFFEYLSTTGFVGLAAYLSMFVVYYWLFFKVLKKRLGEESFESNAKDEPGRHRSAALVSALLFAFPIAYLVQGLLLFDVLPIYMNLFIFMAFMNYKFHAARVS